MSGRFPLGVHQHHDSYIIQRVIIRLWLIFTSARAKGIMDGIEEIYCMIKGGKTNVRLIASRRSSRGIVLQRSQSDLEGRRRKNGPFVFVQEDIPGSKRDSCFLSSIHIYNYIYVGRGQVAKCCSKKSNDIMTPEAMKPSVSLSRFPSSSLASSAQGGRSHELP